MSSHSAIHVLFVTTRWGRVFISALLTLTNRKSLFLSSLSDHLSFPEAKMNFLICSKVTGEMLMLHYRYIYAHDTELQSLHVHAENAQAALLYL